MKLLITLIICLLFLCGCTKTELALNSVSASSIQEALSSSTIEYSLEEEFAFSSIIADDVVEKVELYDFTFFTAANSSTKFNLEKENVLFSYHQGWVKSQTISVQLNELEKSIERLKYEEERGNYPPYGTDSLHVIILGEDKLLAYGDRGIGNLWLYNVNYLGTKAKAKDIGNIIDAEPRYLKNGAVLLGDKMIDWDGNEWPVQLQFNKSAYLPFWDKMGDKYYIEDIYYDPASRRYIALFGSMPPEIIARNGEKRAIEEKEEKRIESLINAEEYYETGIAVFNENGQELNRFYFPQHTQGLTGENGISDYNKRSWGHDSFRLIPINKNEFLIEKRTGIYHYLLNTKTQELQYIASKDEKAFAAANPQVTLYDRRFYKTPKPCPLVVEYQKDGTYVYTGDEERKQLAKLEPKEGSRYEPRFYTVDDTDTTYILFQEVEAS